MKKHKILAKIKGETVLKVTWSTALYAILIVVVVFVIAGSILAYGTNTQLGQKIAAKIAVVIPLPAAIVDWTHFVSINEVDENLASVEKYYQTQNFSGQGMRVDFSTPEGQKRLEIKKREIVDKMVEDKIIEVLAKQRGINISKADVDKAVDAKLKEFGTTNDVKNDLLKSYGWTIDDFKEKIVLPSMYTEALSKAVMNVDTSNNAEAKAKIQEAQLALQNGKDFAEVAKQFSDGNSKDDGGELGWATKEQVMPELANVLFDSKPMQKNQIIESAIGFHIVEIENKKKQGDQDVVQLRQIFVAKNTFADWLLKQKKQMRVMIPMSEFVWNASTGSVEFRDNSMKTFEQNERAKAQGDASLLL